MLTAGSHMKRLQGDDGVMERDWQVFLGRLHVFFFATLFVVRKWRGISDILRCLLRRTANRSRMLSQGGELPLPGLRRCRVTAYRLTPENLARRVALTRGWLLRPLGRRRSGMCLTRGQRRLRWGGLHLQVNPTVILQLSSTVHHNPNAAVKA